MKRPDKAIYAAIMLLTKWGYRIASPPCPACHDHGFIMTSGTTPGGGGWVGNADCPRGCPRPTLHNGSSRPAGGTPMVDARAAGTRYHPL